MRREDLFTVVHEQFPTDTVDYADIVLPATTQLEHLDRPRLVRPPLRDAQRNPSIAPIGEARSNNDVFRDLAARLGLEADLFPDDETLIRQALDGGPSTRGITLERLREDPSIRLDIPEPFTPFAEGSSPPPPASASSIPSGCSPTASTPCRPTSPAPGGPGRTRPDLAGSYPLQLLSPPRPQFLNSTFANSPTHRAAAGDPDGRTFGRGCRGAGGWSTASGLRSSTPVVRSAPASALTGAVKPGVAVATGLYWNKLVPRPWQRQHHHLDRPDRHGRGRHVLR